MKDRKNQKRFKTAKDLIKQLCSTPEGTVAWQRAQRDRLAYLGATKLLRWWKGTPLEVRGLCCMDIEKDRRTNWSPVRFGVSTDGPISTSY